MKTTYQVIIIGGGPAGLSTALVLGRSHIKTRVINAETPRNSITKHSHGFLTNDGKHPLEILETAKSELSKYPSITYDKDTVISLESIDKGFKVTTNAACFTADRIVLATGYKDQLPAVGIPNIEAVYGTSVFPCPFCDGYEMSEKKLAVFGDASFAPAFSIMIQHWSKDVMVFTNGDPVNDTDLLNDLHTHGIPVIEEKISALHEKHGVLQAIILENGQIIARDGGFLKDTKALELSPSLEHFGLETETGRFGIKHYLVNASKETNLKGFYIIGDARTGWTGVATAVAEGYELGANITVEIINEHWTQ